MRLPLVFLSSYSQSEKTLYIFYIFLKKGHAHSASDDRFIMKVLVCFVPCKRVIVRYDKRFFILDRTIFFSFLFWIPILCCCYYCATITKLIVFLVGARVTRVSSLGLPSSRFPPLTDELMVTLSLSLCLSPPIVCFSLLLFTSGATPTVYHFFVYETEGGQHGPRRCGMVMMIDFGCFR
jgi:hypothetical protein